MIRKIGIFYLIIIASILFIACGETTIESTTTESITETTIESTTTENITETTTLIDYTITFMNNDGTINKSETFFVGEDISNIEYPIINEIDGFIFLGWDIDLPNAMPNNDLVLNQVWERELRLVTDNFTSLNPHVESSPLYEPNPIIDLLIDTLYVGDYDWDKAISQGLATQRGDFSSGAGNIPYGRFPSMASQEPLDLNQDGLSWDIYIRDDLYFEDGTKINASTFVYSWKMLLDPTLNYLSAEYLYDHSELPILNASEYHNQDINSGNLVAFSSVGISVDNDNENILHLELEEPRTKWEMMGYLENSALGVVHPQKYDQGLSTDGRTTSYNENLSDVISYGPYTITSYDNSDSIKFALRDDYIYKENYEINYINYDIIQDRNTIEDLFDDGKLDLIDTGIMNYHDFMDYEGLYLDPSTTSLRLYFNIEGSETYDLNPLLIYPEFRKAIYFAIDRETYATDIRGPAYPTQGFIGPAYLSSEFNLISYRNSEAGISVLEDYSPLTYGFDPVRAKALFDQAYANAVASGSIVDGETVHLEIKYYDVETGFNPWSWFETSLESIFNEGDETKFDLDLVGVSSDAITLAEINGDFEVLFGGWQGMKNDAPYLLGAIYNSAGTYMNEKGFDTANQLLSIELPNTLLAITNWMNEYNGLTNPSIELTNLYDDWTTIYSKFNTDTGVLTCTFNELYEYLYSGIYNEFDYYYQGREEDFNKITAAIESMLLEQMIAIPVITSIQNSILVSSDIVLPNDFNTWISRTDLRYIEIISFDLSND